MRVDILYLAWNRLEFTRKSFETMLANTDWSSVSRLVIFDDGSTDGTSEYLQEVAVTCPAQTTFWKTKGVGPVGVMREFLAGHYPPAMLGGSRPEVFAKIDNDVMLPPGWLGECLDQMHGVDLLGIEARIGEESAGPGPRTTYPAEFIGGIGLMRRSAFRELPEPDGPRSRFGFTAWQTQHPEVNKAWISPPIPVCLLNMAPLEPWASLSRQYVAKGWQREWPGQYGADRSELWEWWT